jgi:hypothetical protein
VSCIWAIIFRHILYSHWKTNYISRTELRDVNLLPVSAEVCVSVYIHLYACMYVSMRKSQKLAKPGECHFVVL